MKAVIVDLAGNEAVALCNDGQFVKLKNEHYSIGQEIQMQPKVVRFPKQIAVAASFAIVLGSCGGVGTYAWAKPVSVVSLDINPSIEYSLNRFDRVISVTGKNNDGERIVDALGNTLKNTDITTALTITVEQLSTDAYLDADNTNYMVIGVYSKNNSKASSLKDTVDAFTPDSAEVCSIATVNVSEEVKETADSLGITGGKMELINEIASVATDPADIDYSTMTDLTVAQLEETKLAAASGASVPEAVASVSNGNEVAVASERKLGDDNTSSDDSSASETKSDEKSSENSSSTKDTAEKVSDEDIQQVSNTTPASAGVTTASGTESIASADSQPVSDEQTTSSEGTSTDIPADNTPIDNSSGKEDKGTSSKKNSNHSKKKNNGSGSSPAKDSDTSETKTEEVEETNESQQIQNAFPSDEDSSDSLLIEDSIIYSELPVYDNTLA